MIAILCATILFIIFLSLGVILMFVTPLFYTCVPVFILFLCILKLSYRKANCKPLERKDFIITFIMTSTFSLLLMTYTQEHVDLHVFSFLYLITFVSLLVFADSIRFKSLM